jgi:ankyrin repeat protein
MIGKHQKVAELLLEHGADPNVQDDNNNTPVHLALQSGLVERAELFACVAYSNARDDGNTILLP